MIDRIIKYFDLASKIRTRHAVATGGGQPKKPHWLPQYIALLLGIIVQPYFNQYQATGQWNFHGLFGWILFSMVVAILIFPAVYKRSFDPQNPIVIQFCVIFAGGMGWNALLKTAVRMGVSQNGG